MRPLAWVCRFTGAGITASMLSANEHWTITVIGTLALIAFVDASIYLARRER